MEINIKFGVEPAHANEIIQEIYDWYENHPEPMGDLHITQDGKFVSVAGLRANYYQRKNNNKKS